MLAARAALALARGINGQRMLLLRIALGVRNVSGTPENSSQRARLDLDKNQVQTMRTLVEKELPDEVIVAYVRDLVAPLEQELAAKTEEGRRLEAALTSKVAELHADIARVEAERARVEAERRADVASVRFKLNTAMAELLELEGLLNQRGLLEFIQRTMGDQWNRFQPEISWCAFIDGQTELRDCLLQECKLTSGRAAAELRSVYTTLSNKIHDAPMPEEYQKQRRVLYIGPPLGPVQRKVMMCLCKHFGVPHAVWGTASRDDEADGEGREASGEGCQAAQPQQPQQG